MHNTAPKDRCPWCGTDPLYVAYHDTEWGVPERDGRQLFEKLVLDGFQAGLSWITILRKRDNFRRVFDGFNPEALARWTEDDVVRALGDPGIVRHRGKIEAAIGNARAWSEIEERQGFSDFLWGFVADMPTGSGPRTHADVPTQTAQSVAMSKALKAAGFRFCGPVITYAFMQATGMVNDHLESCFRRDQV